jgi:hypothetical protein
VTLTRSCACGVGRKTVIARGRPAPASDRPQRLAHDPVPTRVPTRSADISSCTGSTEQPQIESWGWFSSRCRHARSISAVTESSDTGNGMCAVAAGSGSATRPDRPSLARRPRGRTARPMGKQVRTPDSSASRCAPKAHPARGERADRCGTRRMPRHSCARLPMPPDAVKDWAARLSAAILHSSVGGADECR